MQKRLRLDKNTKPKSYKNKPRRQRRDLLTLMMKNLKVNLRDVMYYVSQLAETDLNSNTTTRAPRSTSSPTTPWAVGRKFKILSF